MTLEIIVAADGSLRMEAHGFRGSTCIEATRFIEQALGKVTSDLKTAGYYEQPAQSDTRIRHEGDSQGL